MLPTPEDSQRALAARRESLRREARREVDNVDSKILSDIAALANPAASMVQLLSALAVALDAKVDGTSTAAGFQGKQHLEAACSPEVLLTLEYLAFAKLTEGQGLCATLVGKRRSRARARRIGF